MGFRVLPLFEDIDALLRNVYRLQQQYLFFCVHTLEVLRAYKDIAEKNRRLLLFQRQQIQFMLEFNAARGSFIQPAYEGQFAHIAHTFCFAMHNHISYQYINGHTEPDEECYCRRSRLPSFVFQYYRYRSIWSILRVLFTDMGEPEYRQVINR